MAKRPRAPKADGNIATDPWEPLAREGAALSVNGVTAGDISGPGLPIRALPRTGRASRRQSGSSVVLTEPAPWASELEVVLSPPRHPNGDVGPRGLEQDGGRLRVIRIRFERHGRPGSLTGDPALSGTLGETGDVEGAPRFERAR